MFSIFLLIGLALIGIYLFIDSMVENEKLAKLEKHTLTSGEKILQEFEYENDKYVVVKYYDDTSSWSHLYILFNTRNQYYILKDIKKCDCVDSGNNIYVKNNAIYIHCIGKDGDVLEYIVNDMSVEENIRHLDYQYTPNISQYHLEIDKVDEQYIYLSSFKLDTMLEDGDKVKCSLKDNICYYE